MLKFLPWEGKNTLPFPAALEDFMAKKEELLRKELLEAFVKSGKSYAETMKFLKEGKG